MEAGNATKKKLKVVIVGGVAGGASCAARWPRGWQTNAWYNLDIV
jgi:hypothetical protein